MSEHSVLSFVRHPSRSLPRFGLFFCLYRGWCSSFTTKAHFDEDGMAVLVGRDAVSAKRDYDSAFALPNGCE